LAPEQIQSLRGTQIKNREKSQRHRRETQQSISR